jgi:hypothetical protein
MQWPSLSAVVNSLKAHKFLFASALLLIALPIGYSATRGSQASRFIASALADPLAVLEGRSPGGRPSGALAQSKPKKQIPIGLGKPSERVLANVRSRPVIPAAMTNGVGQSPFMMVPGLYDAPAATQKALATTVEPTSNPNGLGNVLFPIGGGTGSVPPPLPVVPVPPVPEPPVSPIPEPQTWLMMIIGFVMTGHALRSRPRARVGENEQKQNI